MLRLPPSPSLDPPRRLREWRIARSVWFSGPRHAELRQERIGSPGRDQILVSSIRSAISQGTEMLVYRGQVDTDLGLDLPTLQGSFAFPIKYGYASVGRVEKIGADVEQVREGDLVFVHHPHQSCFLVPASSAVKLPAGADPEAAALLANLETAINIVLDARPSSGDRVVIFGQGVVGLLLTQMMRPLVRQIIAVDPIAKRRQLAETVGADQVLEPGDRLAGKVRDATDGVGADTAIEISGHPSALQQAIDSVRFQGTVVVASWYGTKPVTLNLGGAFHRNRLRMISSQVSHLDPALGPSWTRERRLATAIDRLPELIWQPLITHRFPIEQAAEAYQLLDERPAEAVQVLFTHV